MDIVLANPRGFCAGVDRAIAIVEQALAEAARVAGDNDLAETALIQESRDAPTFSSISAGTRAPAWRTICISTRRSATWPPTSCWCN